MSCNDWRDVVGFEGYYQVSRFGEVCRLRSDGTRKPPLRGWAFNSSGHIRVSLMVNGVRTDETIHRIVLTAWVGPCLDGWEACHNNGNPANNNLSNLRWDTHSSNVCDCVKHGKHIGKPKRRVRRSDAIEFDSVTEAAEFTGCHDTAISRACKNPNRTTKGFGWSYC